MGAVLFAWSLFRSAVAALIATCSCLGVNWSAIVLWMSKNCFSSVINGKSGVEVIYCEKNFSNSLWINEDG